MDHFAHMFTERSKSAPLRKPQGCGTQDLSTDQSMSHPRDRPLIEEPFSVTVLDKYFLITYPSLRMRELGDVIGQLSSRSDPERY